MCADPVQPGHAEALRKWQEGHQLQMGGDLEGAERLYRESLDLHPTAEAWTFLGWVFSWRRDPLTAIEYCHRAIAVDPTFGNPYNDIGAYLLELDRAEEAIPWLRKALDAQRYEARVYAWMNLGRAFERLGRNQEAIEHYRRATEADRPYRPAAQGLERLLTRRNGQVKHS
jgi:Tfp pilus assembly protein PilF